MPDQSPSPPPQRARVLHPIPSVGLHPGDEGEVVGRRTWEESGITREALLVDVDGRRIGLWLHEVETFVPKVAQARLEL